jgi:hypothetical protein
VPKVTLRKSRRLQDHPEGDSRHEHWREVMAIVQKTRRRKMERRHLLR